MFVTALPYNANLGGIVGADNKCSTASNKPSSGTYKALIVDDVNRRACTSVNCTSGGVTEQIDWVLAPNTTYVQAIDTSKTIFISNANGVNTNNLTDVISPASTGIWTGIRNNPSWDWLTYSGFTCSSWTDGVTTTCGSYGVTSWTDSRSISIYTVTAGGPTQYNLLCVEQ
ncbi:DUF1554 domain-containing protein [Leptospira vanthielii]|nr:DUF1554 domain-containing protein [Leptospira vanthielii]